MKLDLTLDAVLAARKIITDKLTIAINQPTGIDEGRYAHLLADVKALDEIAAPLIEAAKERGRKAVRDEVAETRALQDADIVLTDWKKRLHSTEYSEAVAKVAGMILDGQKIDNLDEIVREVIR